MWFLQIKIFKRFIKVLLLFTMLFGRLEQIQWFFLPILLNFHILLSISIACHKFIEGDKFGKLWKLSFRIPALRLYDYSLQFWEWLFNSLWFLDLLEDLPIIVEWYIEHQVGLLHYKFIMENNKISTTHPM